MAWLDEHKQEVDALNVFPVPDGDTGTNMYLTAQQALKDLQSHLRGSRGSVSVGEVAEVIAQGALMGARGNSGVILSQLLRGFARELAGHSQLYELLLAQSAQAAVRKAYQAVMKPVEGTILTVARETANWAADHARLRPGMEAMLEGMWRRAEAALANTPRQLAVLREAGVVDSGGKGLVYLIEGALRCLQSGELGVSVAPDVTRAVPSRAGRRRGTEPESAVMTGPASVVGPVPEPAGMADRRISGLLSEQTTQQALRYRYCTEFLIRGEHLEPDVLRSHLSRMDGDSLLVVGEPELVKVHIHVNDPGLVLSYCGQFGELLEIGIHNMAVQSEARSAHILEKAAAAGSPDPRLLSHGAGHAATPLPGTPTASAGALPSAEAQPAAGPAAETQPTAPAAPAVADSTAHARAEGDSRQEAGREQPAGSPGRADAVAPGEPADETVPAAGVVAVAAGQGMEDIFLSLGADQVVRGGQTMNPSAQDLVAAIQAVRAREVIVLPNNGNVILTAQQACRLAGRPARIVASSSMQQGIAALLAYNRMQDAQANVSAMEAAARKVHSGEVTYAVRGSRLNGFNIQEHDIIGILDGNIVAVADSPEAVVEQMVKGIASSCEIITLYRGADVREEDAQALVERLHSSFPDLEVEQYYGGQPVYFYLLSGE